MQLIELSEIVAGFVISGTIPPSAVNANNLVPPYNNIVKLCEQGKQDFELMNTVGIQPYNTCMAAASTVDPKIAMSLIPMLEKAALNSEVGSTLSKLSRLMEKGEDVDLTKVKTALDRYEEGTREFTTMDRVEKAVNPWTPTFFKPVDYYVGGMPAPGLTLLGAPPGTGKTSLVVELIISMAEQGKKVVLFSLEMTLGLIRTRIENIRPEVSNEILSRVIASDEVYSYHDVYAKIGQLIATHDDIYAVFIDFADLMIPETKEESTEIAGAIYRSMAKASKATGVPIILLSQLSYGYVGGLPRVHHIRYSRLAEAMASMILLLFNSDQLFADMGQGRKNSPLPYREGYGYIIVGKSRFGLKQGTVGAIQLPWRGEQGWENGIDDANWFQLAGT
jgi:hypothetical protein